MLEINLIKKYRPRYNIMFMDDSSYPYIKLTHEAYPTLRVVRDAKKRPQGEILRSVPGRFGGIRREAAQPALSAAQV